ncbi:hypothetical protein IU443_23680 [Nocardia farcinica]|uniref:Lipopolysaccharide assembly protein A domain-containing protein n=2 Tax=Nocardia farcinica TaxID=37329 RepID=Q5Z0S4_NOCFA|nr:MULTISPECIES: hypothetical protein [Nocardia]AXK86147.1 hypothetical protein DXT66_11400 [Nocardia farcinica]MBA4855105.1 hypothetical protein [Nocardia farcinica]MBC9815897.1 hypothetical protein [Nocardia farcinica]MBF6072267.1 hypothetical protein [Nocardia farcinica]MBF6142049.1 hypothetical protein [Nocardia farcinica]
MFIVLGLLVLIAAVVVGVSIAAADLDRMRAPAGDFEIFGSLFTPTVGEVFGVGILVGAAGMLGLLLLSTGVWRSARRGSEARRELRRSRREVAAARRAAPAPQAPAGAPPAPPQTGGPMWSANRFLRRPPGSGPAKA